MSTFKHRLAILWVSLVQLLNTQQLGARLSEGKTPVELCQKLIQQIYFSVDPPFQVTDFKYIFSIPIP